MAIPEKQLATWANVGAESSAQKTYASIKTALESSKSVIRGKPEIYLQGSYKNTTNIYGDSDVDVVVESDLTYYYDNSALTPLQKAAFDRQFVPTTYPYEQFRDDVEATLVAYYGRELVKPRNKCLEVVKAPGRLNADVVPAQHFRRYVSDASPTIPGYHLGMAFFTRQEGRQVVNYPKLHYKSGVEKNRINSERYKPAVRIMKNLRNYMSAENLIAEDIAPSYFVECLVYNAPNECFRQTYFQTTVAIMQWFYKLLTEGNLDKLVCGNRVVWLFGDTPEQWKVDKAKTFMNAAIATWNNYDK